MTLTPPLYLTSNCSGSTGNTFTLNQDPETNPNSYYQPVYVKASSTGQINLNSVTASATNGLTGTLVTSNSIWVNPSGQPSEFQLVQTSFSADGPGCVEATLKLTDSSGNLQNLPSGVSITTDTLSISADLVDAVFYDSQADCDAVTGVSHVFTFDSSTNQVNFWAHITFGVRNATPYIKPISSPFHLSGVDGNFTNY